MFCTNCGKEINDNAIICVHCGAPTKSSAPQVSVLSTKPKKVNVFGIVGFVLDLLSILFGLYFFENIVLGIIFCIVVVSGLIFSIIGTARIKKYNVLNGMAIAGLVLPCVIIVFFGSYLLLLAVLLGG